MVNRKIALVVALVSAVSAGGHVTAATTDPAQAGQATIVVDVVAERFAFVPAEITVDQGTVVEIRLTSEDTIHGFRVSGGARPIDVAIPKRGRGDIRVRFEAVEPGRFMFECSRVCGAGHSFMRGTIRVRPRTPAQGGS
jgi:cytochrome c oxidase subunit 2